MLDIFLSGAVLLLAAAGLLMGLGLLELRRRLRQAELRLRDLERRASAPPMGAEAASGTPAESPRDSGSVPVEHVMGVRPSAPGGVSASATTRPERAAAPPEVERPAPDQSPPRRTDWEQWLGTRGAGWLGGAVGSLAAILLFVHAVQEGWITPALRVGAGALFGVVGAVGSEWLHRRRFTAAGDGVLGAAATAWFAAAWAASQLYGFIPAPAAFVAMAAGTAGCAVAAWRRRSSVAALMILLGGFATPLLLGDGSDQRWTLFGYLFVLDLLAVATAHALRRSWMASIALLATTGMQVLWFGEYGGADDGPFLIGLLVVFGLLFATTAAGHPRRGGLSVQGLAATLPLVLLTVLARSSGVELDPWWIAGSVWLLQGAARGLAERTRAPGLGPLTAAASVLLLAVTVFAPGPDSQASSFGLALAVLAVGAGACVGPKRLPTRLERRAAAIGACGAVAIGGAGTRVVEAGSSVLGVAVDLPLVLASLAVAARVLRLPFRPTFGYLLAFAFGFLLWAPELDRPDAAARAVEPLVGAGVALALGAAGARLGRRWLAVDAAPVVDALAFVVLWHWGVRGTYLLELVLEPRSTGIAWSFAAGLTLTVALALWGGGASRRSIGGLPLGLAALIGAPRLASSSEPVAWVQALGPMAALFAALVLLPEVLVRRPVRPFIGWVRLNVAQIGVFAGFVVLGDPGGLATREAAALAMLAILGPVALVHVLAELRAREVGSDPRRRSSLPSLTLTSTLAMGAAVAVSHLHGIAYLSVGLLGITAFEARGSRPLRRGLGVAQAVALAALSVLQLLAARELLRPESFPLGELGVVVVLLATAGPGFAWA
ncbi:MAG: DUF2339 domain-containing protein, partial [Planctomycetota bacterium]